MKSSFGSNLTLSLFGESHGTAIGVVIDGLPAGLALDTEHIERKLALRRAGALSALSTARQEADRPHIVSGYFNGHTTGTPLTVIIENANTKSGDYEKTKNLLRPGHADYTAFIKYGGWQDYRGGGHFSGRLTAPIVAAGAICEQLLAAHDIAIATHIAECAGVCDAPLPADNLRAAVDALNTKLFAVLDDTRGEEMQAAILAAKSDLDSVGGILETAVCGCPAGLGEPFFNSVESIISHLVFSVPAVKGIEFGAGFGFAKMRGSAANDPLRMAGDKIVTATNNNGGINGGITNGMPIIFRTVIKPTPSIYQTQQTVDFATRENAELNIQGRHDPAIIHRARPVIDAMTAIALTELMMANAATHITR